MTSHRPVQLCRRPPGCGTRSEGDARALRARRGGFTLIELVVSITVSVIICGLAATLLWNASSQRAQVAARVEMIDTGAVAIEKMLRYVREIPQGVTASALNGKAQIDFASATELRFDSTFGFRLNTTSDTIEMTTDNAANWYPLVADASGLTITYANRAGASLTSFPLSLSDREGVRHIGVELMLSRSSQNVKLKSSLYLRSFMDEVLTTVGP